MDGYWGGVPPKFHLKLEVVDPSPRRDVNKVLRSEETKFDGVHLSFTLLLWSGGEV